MHQFRDEWNEDTEVFLHAFLNSPAEFGDALHLASRIGTGRLRLNLSGITLLSSAQMGQMVVLKKQLAQTGGQLILCKLSPGIYEQLEKTGFDQLLQIEDSDDNEDSSPILDHPKKPTGGATSALPETA